MENGQPLAAASHVCPRSVRICLLASVALWLTAVASCRRSDPGPPQPQTGDEQAGQVEGVPAPAPPEPPPPPPSQAVTARAENVARASVAGEVDAFLTGELRNFIQQKQRMPTTFAEFAGLRLDTIPRPPPGKKWVIDTETLEVKAVGSQ